MLLQVTDKIINKPNSSIQSVCIKSQEFRFANGQKKTKSEIINWRDVYFSLFYADIYSSCLIKNLQYLKIFNYVYTSK